MDPESPDPNAIFPPPKSVENQPDKKSSAGNAPAKTSERKILGIIAIVLIWAVCSHYYVSAWITPLSLPVGFVYALYVTITPEKHPPWVRNLAKAILFAGLALVVLVGILLAICSHAMKY